MNNRFVHLIFTRHGIGIYDTKYFEHRLSLFKTFTFPSLRSQTNQDFYWIIRIGADMPDQIREELNTIIGDYRNAIIVPTTTSTYSAGTSYAPMEHAEKLIREKGFDPDGTMVLTSRIDDDDCWHRNTVDYVQTFMSSYLETKTNASEGVLLTFPLGYVWTVDEFLDIDKLDTGGLTTIKRSVLPLYYPCHSPSVHVLSHPRSNITCGSYNHTRIMDELGKRGYAICLERKDEPMWVFTRHRYADSSISRQSKYKEIDPVAQSEEFFNQFGIDKKDYLEYIDVNAHRINLFRKGKGVGLYKEKDDYAKKYKELSEQYSNTTDPNEKQYIKASIEKLETEFQRKLHNLEYDRLQADLQTVVLKLQRLAIESTEKTLKIEEQQKQIEKLQGMIVSEASARFRIGDALVGAVRSPRDAIALPIRLWHIYRGYRSKGKSRLRPRALETSKSPAPAPGTTQPSELRASTIRKTSRIQEARILFMPTNGAGLGHITRLLAIARRLRNSSGIAECVFLTTSDALNLFRREGFVAYHFPSADLLRDRIESKEWHSGLRNMLNMVIANHEINAFIFDGVYPYPGMKSAIGKCGDVRRVWVRRMSFKEGVEERLREHEKFFDLQLVPGELGQKGVSQDSSGRIVVPPVVYLDRKELLPREEAIDALGLDSRKKTVFIQPAAGNISPITTEVEIILDTLRQLDGIQVVLTESIISRTGFTGFKGVKIIRGYPLSIYYLAFDLAIGAAGYNTFTELIYFGVPSIFIPRLETVSDNQLARAMLSEKTGTGLVLYPFSIPKLREYLAILLDDARNSEFRRRCLEQFSVNGADIATKLLTDFFLGNTQHCE